MLRGHWGLLREREMGTAVTDIGDLWLQVIHIVGGHDVPFQESHERFSWLRFGFHGDDSHLDPVAESSFA